MTSRPQTYPARLTVNLTRRQAQAIRQAASREVRPAGVWARWHLLRQAERLLNLMPGELDETDERRDLT